MARLDVLARQAALERVTALQAVDQMSKPLLRDHAMALQAVDQPKPLLRDHEMALQAVDQH